MSTLAHILADPARLAVLRATGLVGASDVPASLDRLTRLAALTLDVPAAFLTLVDDECQHIVSHVGLDELADFPRVPLSHSFCQHVVHAGDVVVVEDARDDARVCDSPAVEELGVRSYAGVPLELDGQVIGAFGVAGDCPRRWTEHELEVLTHLALVAAGDVATNARRADELVSQALDSSVLRHLPGTAVLRFDRDLRITFLEGSAVRERGWQPEAMIGRRLDDILPADDFARLRPAYEAILEDHREPFDYTSRAGEVWHCQGAMIAGADGGPAGGTMVMRDVTQERGRERLLAERESQYRLLAQRSTDVISRHDERGRYTYLSPASADVFGYPPEELVGRDPYDLIHPDDVDAVRGRHLRLLDLPDAAASTYRLVRADGRVIWVESIARAVRDEEDRVVELQCATRDVTARHDAEEARRRSEQLTSTIVEALEEGLVVHAADQTLLACNASAERILGLDRDVLAGRDELPPGWQVRDEHGELLPVDERPAAIALRTGRPQVGRIMAVDHPDGRRTWIRANGVPLMDAEGRAHRVLVSFADITDLREAEHDARHRADHDPLTGLPNRARLRRCLEQTLADARAAGGHAAVLFLDLDRFKVINDSLGHGAGDALLVAAADRLRGELRGADVLARFGGDEFVVVAGVDGEAGATALAERLIGVLRAPFVLEGAEHVIRASVGIALAAGGRAEAEELLRSADLAMYRAKEDGRGGYAVFDDGMLERAVERLSLERQLRQALVRDELELHFQPIWTVRGHALAAVEALVRWRHPERGLVPPGHFIPVAEHSGLIVEIGDWVLEEACRQLAEWRRRAPGPPPPVNVNVSVRQLDDPHFPARVAAVLDAHRLPPQALALEVTESLLMSRPDQAQGGLEALRDLGVRLVLDDFGTGYSSLSRLSRLPLHTLKVDRSFVAALPRDPADHAIVQAIFSMASTLGLRVVAEGVETEEQLAMLRRLGCDMAQGYLLGRPAPAAEVALLLARDAGR